MARNAERPTMPVVHCTTRIGAAVTGSPRARVVADSRVPDHVQARRRAQERAGNVGLFGLGVEAQSG